MSHGVVCNHTRIEYLVRAERNYRWYGCSDCGYMFEVAEHTMVTAEKALELLMNTADSLAAVHVFRQRRVTADITAEAIVRAGDEFRMSGRLGWSLCVLATEERVYFLDTANGHEPFCDIGEIDIVRKNPDDADDAGFMGHSEPRSTVEVIVNGRTCGFVRIPQSAGSGLALNLLLHGQSVDLRAFRERAMAFGFGVAFRDREVTGAQHRCKSFTYANGKISIVALDPPTASTEVTS